MPPTFFEAWVGALAYTFQLYFDFSGYSDMAIGLARMFGIRFPMNFNSPYKAANIIDFWRRWHITLSRFLRDYLYIPLGGNRKGPSRRHVNLMATMLLGGLWHGAGWTFVIWGGLHGVLPHREPLLADRPGKARPRGDDAARTRGGASADLPLRRRRLGLFPGRQLPFGLDDARARCSSRTGSRCRIHSRTDSAPRISARSRERQL